MDDSQHVGKHMDPELLRDPQHPIPILQNAQPLVQQADLFQHFASHQRGAGTMKTFGGMKLPPPIRGIFPRKLDSGSILASQDMAGSDESDFGVIPQESDLHFQLSRKPLVIRVEAGNEIALGQRKHGIPGRRSPPVHGQSHHMRLRHQILNSGGGGIRGRIITDQDLQIATRLHPDTLKRTPDAMGAIIGRNDDADEHGSGKNAENRQGVTIFFKNHYPLHIGKVLEHSPAMSMNPNAFKSWCRGNPALVLALITACTLSLIGVNWGRVECWNLDNMAFLNVKSNGLAQNYLKPPLHTYLNHILVMKPVEAVRCMLGLEHNWQYPVQLAGARLITLALFCGSIILLHRTARRFSGPCGAGAIVLLAATSAGLIKFNHFGTADSPLLFWMLASFGMALIAAESGRSRDAFLAGILAGLAAADKYNGLGVAAAIPAAFLATRGWKSLFSQQCWMGVLAVQVGFIIGNPGAVLDTRNFVQDFLYNLYTTPVYDGKTQGSGYVDFLLCFPQLIGWPASILVLATLVASLILLLGSRLSRDEKVLMAASGAVFLFYFITIGRFPRMADRFVLPVVPFALFLGAPALSRIRWRHPLVALPFAAILAYNIFCSVEVGRRFLSDPRMDAQVFARKNFPRGATIENSYAPYWNRLPGLDVTVHLMPYVTGRSGMFTKIFGQNEAIQAGIGKHESSDYSRDTFTAEGLAKRNPDFITFSNQVYQFTPDEQAQWFYRALDDGHLGYRKIFEKSWRPRVPYTYPRDIDFLAERIVILQRKSD